MAACNQLLFDFAVNVAGDIVDHPYAQLNCYVLPRFESTRVIKRVVVYSVYVVHKRLIKNRYLVLSEVKLFQTGYITEQRSHQIVE